MTTHGKVAAVAAFGVAATTLDQHNSLGLFPPPLLLIRPKPPQNKGGINLVVPKSEVDFEVF